MRNLINLYSDAIRENCFEDFYSAEKDVDYWRNFLFFKTIEVVIPFSLITLVPGVMFCLVKQLYVTAFLDLLTFIILLIVGFAGGLNVKQRKVLFVFNSYFAASFLLFYVGIVGPGLLFLYASCIFGLLILSKRYAFLWTFMNIVIVLLFSLVLHYDLSPTPEVNVFGVMEWIAIAVNLIFLSLMSSALLPKLFEGLSETFEQQQALQLELTTKSGEQALLLKELEKRNIEIEHFAFVASHDLQEPLRMVTSFLSKLEYKYGSQLDVRARQYISFATKGAIRMKQLILDILEYSKAGKHELVKEEIDLNLMIEEYKSSRTHIIDSQEVKLSYDKLPIIHSYKIPLQQVLHNILDNAIKYCEPGKRPEIEISVKDKEESWVFSVKDNGIGIDQEFYEKIFVIFQRLHDRDEYSGTGIGLAIVKKNIESLNGEVWLQSYLGHGSTFYFSIPK